MSEQVSLGAIDHSHSNRRTDYLYRISIKSLVRNEKGEILVVKEAGRTYWDLPGGGMDHSEDIKTAIAREMKEETNLEGDFEYKIIAVDDPAYLSLHDFWQVRLIFELQPENMAFSRGEDGDEVAFIHPDSLKDSTNEVERRIYTYANIAS
jgi:ADP-ribose pyrophosphatase YjhB (NUDIX family)